MQTSFTTKLLHILDSASSPKLKHLAVNIRVRSPMKVVNFFKAKAVIYLREGRELKYFVNHKRSLCTIESGLVVSR